MLAALFDPALGTHPVIDRKVVFPHWGRGRRRNDEANTAVAWHVRGAIAQGSTVAGAIQSATDKFGVDDSTVKKLWGGIGELLKRPVAAFPGGRKKGNEIAYFALLTGREQTGINGFSWLGEDHASRQRTASLKRQIRIVEESGRNIESRSGSMTCLTTFCAARSATVGTPKIRWPPDFLGRETARTGGGK
jgi:hypothetical protein